MTELEILQKKRREEAARRREKLKERKRRAHRLIERGAILEGVINEFDRAERFTNEEIQKILWFALLHMDTVRYIQELGG